MSQKPIRALRQRLLNNMNMRRFVPDTQREHTRAVEKRASLLGRSPDTAPPEELRAFQLRLNETGLQPPSINAIVIALWFFFKVTLDRQDTTRRLVFVYEPRNLRALTRSGVAPAGAPPFTVAEVPVHIIQRGNNRGACFFADTDYELYLAHLEVLAAKFECTVHAYCLMTNHVHLLLTPQRADGCALLMKHLGQRYVQHVNRTYRRSGTLWEGRFRSCLAQSERYVLACYRYIELNPRRAGMASHPRRYRWSSYRINAEGKASNLIEPHDQFVRLGSSAEARRQAYRALFRDASDEAVVNEIRAATNGGFVLGAARFQQEIAAMLGRRVTPGQAGRPPRKDTERASAGPNRLQDRPMRDGDRRRKNH